MTPRTMVWRSLTFFWRSNLAVVAGVATAVAVLAGALVVGGSVRGTLRDLAVSRLGATDVAVFSGRFFRDQLAADLTADPAFQPAFAGAVPLVILEGFVTVQTTGRRAGAVRVYGVDDRFWTFNSVRLDGPQLERQALLSPALAEETGASAGVPVLVRVELPSDVPLESLHGRKDDTGRTIRATIQGVLPADRLGEFALSPEQGQIRAVFLPLARLQQELDLRGRVNTLLVSTRAGPEDAAAAIEPVLRRVLRIEDAGLSMRVLPEERVLVLGSDAGLIDDAPAAAASQAAAALALHVEPVFTYLANTIRVGTREVPYSLVTARDIATMLPARGAAGARPPIVLNTWAARDLNARVGDRVTLDYYLWEEPGRLVTRSADFDLAAVVPIHPRDRDLAPRYPGITDSPTLDDWNPPFPLDLKRVRKVDEDYWTAHRTTPKAFIGIEEGRRLWGSRYGSATSLRLSPATSQSADAVAIDDWQARVTAAIRAELGPASAGMVVRHVRSQALSASAGVTDFGQYFIYFSFFLVVSALVLAALFFKLGVEQRVREIGLIRAVGARWSTTRGLFMTEAVVLSVIGSLIGTAGAVAYAWLIIDLLRTRWVDAVGTTALTLHVTAPALVAGASGGVVAAVACTWLALRSLNAISERALLAGELTREASGTGDTRMRPGRWLAAAGATATVALVLMGGGLTGVVANTAGFFGAAIMLLIAGISLVAYWYRRPSGTALGGRGVWALTRLGFRNAAARPVRSALSITVIAAAAFILVAVDAFRKDAIVDTGPSSGLGGYGLVIESLLPVAHDLRTPEGRSAVNTLGVDDVRFESFRLRPGDDTSCLNLYQPTNPRMLGVPDTFARQGRFTFSASLATTDAERANPWLLLDRTYDDGAVPVIADANSLAYVLHSAVGRDIEIDTGAARIRLRVVAALSDSLFQREILVGERAFVRLFPEHEGYRFFLADVPAGRESDVTAAIEDQLSAFGADVTLAADRLAAFHRVENTYLATFQTLGGLGLVIGTIGLATVLLRNVVERRREIALLGAVGYEPRHLRVMLLAETWSLLVTGLVIGAVAAGVAAAPALIERGGRVPLSSTGVVLLLTVLAAGTVATALAARAASRGPLLDALRSE